jgi:hypothetical protein
MRWPVLWTVVVAGLLWWGDHAHLERYISPRRGLGYWLGIIGGSMMVLLLIYSARKRAARDAVSIVGRRALLAAAVPRTCRAIIGLPRERLMAVAPGLGPQTRGGSTSVHPRHPILSRHRFFRAPDRASR